MLGCMSILQGSIHCVLQAYERHWNPSMGIVEISAVVGLGVLALSPVGKRRSYEIFLIFHRAALVLLVAMLWFHVGASQHLSRPLLLSGTLLYAVALALQLMRQLYVNVNRQFAIGRIKEIDRDGLGSHVIAITPSRRWTVRPGTYALLTVLNWSF
ncbi:hypothetical protein WHR41_09588 [Cladosporium halotolerans]|uniref:Ferric oxidoreductase domain-containing protein n=1 Tax=Cladosporium halotolerans TaxID=1052096 RepID=A0AB34K991_9PEZI